MSAPKNVVGHKQTRSAALELDALASRAEGESRIPVALSSEQPVERWYGREILVHRAEAIDLSYAGEGLPFLDGHDAERQIGLIEDVTLGADGKLRGMLRMGNHPDAGWIFRDIESGIRKNISVGYRIDELAPDTEDDGLYRAMRWTPMEGSTVSIPADITVGIGRSLEMEDTAPAITERTAPAEARDMQDPHAPRGKENIMSEQNTDSTAPTPGVAAVGVDQRTVAAEITRMCIAHEAADKAPEFLARGYTVDQAKAALFDAKVEAARSVTPAGHIGLTEKESRQFNINKAIMAVANKRWQEDGGFEKEVSDTISGRMGRTTGGFFVPMDLQMRASATGNVAGTSSLGGAGVQTSVLSLIDLLRNEMLVKRLGATVLSGLTGNIDFPRQITANSLSWTGENPSTGNSNTAATVDKVSLSPKTAMVSSAYSRQLLVQSSFDAAAFVQNDMALVAALGLDLAALDGTGSANQPTGIMRQTGVTVITHTGTNGGIPTFAEMVSYETNVAVNNADIGATAFAITPGLRGKLKTTLKSTTAGSAYIFESDGTINGYRAEVTNQIPSNYTAGTSTTIAHGVVFGVWSELLIGEWSGAMEVIVDPYTLASQNMIQVHQVMLVDIGVRHPKAFAISKTALIA